MRCPAFEPLTTDMKLNNIEKEHYQFKYNGFMFDVILSFVADGYEILVAIHTHNWGCVLKMNNNFHIEMQDNDYYALRKILHLDWNNDHFSSSAFLRLLSEQAPHSSNRRGVDYKELRNYLPYRQVDERYKIYFNGWNDHIKDNRKAHNFDKTEFYLGKKIADYCREHNISSRWKDVPKDEKRLTNPCV